MMLLAAVDIEGCAFGVVEVAAQLAADVGCDLTILTAAKVPTGVPDEATLPGDHENVHDKVEHHVEEALNELAQLARARGVACETVVRFGTPEAVVLDAAHELNPRFLVLGTHARTGLSRWVFGSIEEQIVRRSPVPVLVVPAPGTGDHRSAALEQIRAESDG